jgi:hypothetical protein
MAPQVRDLKTRKKQNAKLENYENEPVGIGGRSLTSIRIMNLISLRLGLDRPSNYHP